MLKWRESLVDLDRDTLRQVVEYINNKISPFHLKENGKRTFEKLINKFSLADILDAIDLSARKYLQYDSSDKLTQESVEDFIDKIGGILTIKNRPPVDQKLAYIKGICRNRFDYWDREKCSIILNEYVNALKNYGYTEQQILDDLENELEPKAKEAHNWSEWKSLVEGWTNDVKKWKKS